MAISVQFENMSQVDWLRSTNGSTIDAVVQNLTNSPGETLRKNGGSEKIGADQNALEFVASGNIDLYCCWLHPTTFARFGVQLWYPIHVLGIGAAPTWYVMSDTTSSTNQHPNPNWTPSGSDPSQPYTWNLESGFTIRASPTASHDSLEITVVIDGPPPTFN